MINAEYYSKERDSKDSESKDTFIISNKNGMIINSFDDWKRAFIEIDNPTHWNEYRSAAALAEFFTSPCVGESRGSNFIKKWIKGIFGFDFTPICAEIEHESRFDSFRGHGRIHDMVIWGQVKDKDARVIVCVEAKVDEPFGDYISKELEKARKTQVDKPNSNRYARIKNLCTKCISNESINALSNIKYQLMHYLAGSVTEARKIGGLLFMPILVFHTQSYREMKGGRNKDDYDKFIKSLDFLRMEINDISKEKGIDINENAVYKKEMDGVTVCTSYIDIYPVK